MKDITGLRLTPSEFKRLLIYFYDGKQFRKQDAIAKIAKYWEENGGIVESANKYNGVLKKHVALYMKKD